MRWLILFAWLALPACGQSEEPTSSSAENENVHTAHAEVKAIDGTRIDLDHEEIPNVMPAMQMPFFAEDAATFEGISVGDRVEFSFEVIGGRHMIRSIRKL